MNAWLLSGWLMACGGDATTTHLALTKGASEQMLTQNSLVNTAIIGAQAASLIYAHNAFNKAGHPRIGTLVTIGVLAIRGWAIAHNIEVIRSLR